MNIATPPWEYRPVSPKEAPISPDQPSSGRKRSRRRPARFPASEHFLWSPRRSGNALPNRLCAVAQRDAQTEKPIRDSGIRLRLRYKQLAMRRQLFSESAIFVLG